MPPALAACMRCVTTAATVAHCRARLQIVNQVIHALLLLQGFQDPDSKEAVSTEHFQQSTRQYHWRH